MEEVDKRRFAVSTFISGVFTAILWLTFLITHYLQDPVYLPGIIPGSMEHAYGIILSPILHGSWSHLFSNTLPVFILTLLLFHSYRGIAWLTFGGLWILTGISTWMIGAPDTNHIGASGLIYGLAAFLFFSGILRWEKGLLFISAAVIFLYGSLIWGVLPLEPGISWEGHLSGAVAGTIMAFLLKGYGPPRQVEKELEESDHFLEEYTARQLQRDDPSPTDPHDHKDPHQKKKYTHDGSNKRKP